MNTFLISYDLGVPESSSDYKKVIDYIKSSESWANPLQSVWLVKSSKKAGQIVEDIYTLTDSNDKILVVNITAAPWSTHGIEKEVIDWMKSNI